MNIMKKFYNCCVRSHLQYAYAACCCAKNVNKIEGVQNSPLTLACGAMKNSSTEAMQVLCRVPPLKLWLEAYLITTYVKILCQPDTSPIKSIILAQLANFGSSKLIFSTQCFRMATNKHLKHYQLDKFEPLHIETMKDLLHQPPPVVQAPSGLGNGSTRTHKQAQE